jgi:predicted nucleic acid-binding Zn finger protein
MTEPPEHEQEPERHASGRTAGTIPERTRRAVLECYGEQGRRALAAAEAGSVKRYLDFVVVVGTRDEYIVEDGLCTCDRSLIRNGFCWHQLAARIAVLAGLCEEYDLWYHAALE